MRLTFDTMELQDFVSEAIRQVLSGVRRAQESIESEGCAVNPRLEGVRGGQFIKKIEFDVAVTVNESVRREGRAGLRVVGIGADGKMLSASSSVSTNRIRFEVPILLPSGG